MKVYEYLSGKQTSSYLSGSEYLPPDAQQLSSILKNDALCDISRRLDLSEKNISRIHIQTDVCHEKYCKLENSLKTNYDIIQKHSLNENLHISSDNVRKYQHLLHLQKIKASTDATANISASDKIKISRSYTPHTICLEGSKYAGIADIIIPSSTDDMAVFLRNIFHQAASDGSLHSWTFLPGIYEFSISRPSASYFCNCGLNLSYSKNWIYTGINATLKFKDNSSAGQYVDSQLPTAVLLVSSPHMISGFTIDGNLHNNLSYNNTVGVIHNYLGGNQLTEFCTIKNVHEGIRDVMNFNSISNNRIFALNTGIKILNFDNSITAQSHRIYGNYIKDASTGIELDKTSTGNAENIICSNTVLFSQYNPDVHKSIYIKGGSGNVLQNNYCKNQMLENISPSLDVSAENVILKEAPAESNDFGEF